MAYLFLNDQSKFSINSKMISPHSFFRAKAPPSKRSKRGYGDENDCPQIFDIFYCLQIFYYLQISQSVNIVLPTNIIMSSNILSPTHNPPFMFFFNIYISYIWQMFYKFSSYVLQIFYKCSTNVPQMFYKCSTNVLQIFCKCSYY